jgi:homoserine dehydrogenase
VSAVESQQVRVNITRAVAHIGFTERQVRVGLLGYGRVGQAVATLAEAERARLGREGIDIQIVGALVRDLAKPRHAPPIRLRASAAELFDAPFDVLVDVMGGEHPAFDLIRRAIEAGVHVVTANKTLVATRGQELAALATRHGVAFAYDAAVLAGVPFLGALRRRPLIGSPDRITGIINGTSHFITCHLATGGSFAGALAEAVALGYAEPDSAADVGGRDAAEKLTILLHLAGCRDVRVADLRTRGIDTLTPSDFLGARAVGGVIKPVAIASLDPGNPGAWVGPVVVDRDHAFAAIGGVQNAIEFAAGAGDPVTFAGPGAGPRITAGTILDDVAEAVAGGRQLAAPFGRRQPVSAGSLRQPPASGWFLRAIAPAVSIGELSDRLHARSLVATSLVECGRALIARTAPAAWSTVQPLVDELRAAGHDAIALPVISSVPVR